MNSTEVWARGLVAAFVGGGASAVSGGLALNWDDPKHFGTEHPGHLLKIMFVMFVISGCLSAFTYLKQSPIPPISGTATIPVPSPASTPPSIPPA
jgi:hypothetical protein